LADFGGNNCQQLNIKLLPLTYNKAVKGGNSNLLVTKKKVYLIGIHTKVYIQKQKGEQGNHICISQQQ